MARFDRYLLTQLMAVFGFFALVLVSVYWVNRAVFLFDQLISDGQSALTFLELSLLTLPGIIRLVMPLAAFCAAIYVTNRLTQESELVVMQATGFSPWRLARPVLVFGLIASALMGLLQTLIEPLAARRLADRSHEIAQNVSTQFLREGVFQHPAAGVTLFIGDITADGMLEDVFLSDRRNPLRSAIYTSQRAYVVRPDGAGGPKLVMVDGQNQTLETEGERLALTSFGDFTYDIGGLISSGAARHPGLGEMPTLLLLAEPEAAGLLTGARPEQVASEAHQRLTTPLEAVVAALIGFSTLLMGGFSRFGLTRQILGAVVLLIVVHSLVTFATSASTGSALGWTLLYGPPLVGGLLVFGLLGVAARGGVLWRRRARA